MAEKKHNKEVKTMSETELDKLLESGLVSSTSEKGERYYGKVFKELYTSARNSLVILNRNRKVYGNQKTFIKAVFVLKQILKDLENAEQ